MAKRRKQKEAQKEARHTRQRSRTARRKPAIKLKVSRLKRSILLEAPKGCRASVLLKLVDREDGSRYYSWWAVAGRHHLDMITIPYKYKGEDMIRFDIPDGMRLSAAALQPHLKKFLAASKDQPGDPPIIIE